MHEYLDNLTLRINKSVIKLKSGGKYVDLFVLRKISEETGYSIKELISFAIKT